MLEGSQAGCHQLCSADAKIHILRGTETCYPTQIFRAFWKSTAAQRALRYAVTPRPATVWDFFRFPSCQGARL